MSKVDPSKSDDTRDMKAGASALTKCIDALSDLPRAERRHVLKATEAYFADPVPPRTRGDRVG